MQFEFMDEDEKQDVHNIGLSVFVRDMLWVEAAEALNPSKVRLT
jgi:hypothetical protein